MDALDLMRANRVAQMTAYESECLALATKIVQKHGGKGEGGHLIDRLIFLDAKLNELERRATEPKAEPPVRLAKCGHPAYRQHDDLCLQVGCAHTAYATLNGPDERDALLAAVAVKDEALRGVLAQVGPPGFCEPLAKAEAALAPNCGQSLLDRLAKAEARLAEIDAVAKADADDLAKMRDGSKLTRAGVVEIIVYQQQDIAELRAKLEFLKFKGLTVGKAKDAGQPERLAYVIEPGTCFDDGDLIAEAAENELKVRTLGEELAELRSKLAAVEREASAMRQHAWLERFRKATVTNRYDQISPSALNDIAHHIDRLLDLASPVSASRSRNPKHDLPRQNPGCRTRIP